MPTAADFEYGRAAVALGYMTEAQLKAAFDYLDELRQKDRRYTFFAVLRAMQLITPEQDARVRGKLREQKEIVPMPAVDSDDIQIATIQGNMETLEAAKPPPLDRTVPEQPAPAPKRHPAQSPAAAPIERTLPEQPAPRQPQPAPPRGIDRTIPERPQPQAGAGGYERTVADDPRAAVGPSRPTVSALLGVDAGVELSGQARHTARTPTRAVEGKYDVGKELARGGMGAILFAKDQDIRRQVAVKVMLDASDEQRMLRFLEEAQVTGQLEHPNIVPVHDMGLDEHGHPFFTMKLVHGRALSDVLADLRKCEKEGKAQRNSGDPRYISLTQLLNIFQKVCDAVGFAHSRGVIHRDLKPENIMVGEFGEVLVMDWGLAKIIGRPEAHRERLVISDRHEGGTARTLDGNVAGTPAYMPPEQAQGLIEELDERSDLYSLGAILYEILTLDAPYHGQSVLDILYKVCTEPPQSPSERAPDRSVPRELEAVALRAMAEKKEDRYQSVGELTKEIEAFLEGRTLSTVRYSIGQRLAKWVKRNKVLTGGIVAAILMLVAGIMLTMQYQARQRAEQVTAYLADGQTAFRTGDYQTAHDKFFAVFGLDPGNADAQEWASKASGRLYAEKTAEQNRETARTLAAEAELARLEGRGIDEYDAWVQVLALNPKYPGIEDSLLEASQRATLERNQAIIARQMRSGEFHEAEMADTETQASNLEDRIEQATADIGALQERLDGYGERRAPLLSRLQTLREDLRAARADGDTGLAEEIEGMIADQQRRIDVVDRDLAQVQARLQPLTMARLGMERELSELRVLGLKAFTDAVNAYTTVLSYDRHHEGARERLQALYWERFRESESEGNTLDEAYYRGLVTSATLDPTGETEARLQAPGTVSVRSTPAGATVHVLVYRPGLENESDPRLLPHPFDVAAGVPMPLPETDPPAYRQMTSALIHHALDLPVTILGTTPVEDATLPQGSYLLVIQADDREMLRYPVHLGRDDTIAIDLTLPETLAGDDAWITIPGGPVELGGDPEATLPIPRQVVDVPTFQIARTEVTCREYQAFLNDPEVRQVIELGRGGPAGRVLPYIPRAAPDAGAFWMWDEWSERYEIALYPPDAPVSSISFEDAVAYCEWRSAQAEAAGEPWRYRLPADAEWEKAARGADGRLYPFGNEFDVLYRLGPDVLPSDPYPPEVDTLPLDESPYGVRNLASGVMEWCGAWYGEDVPADTALFRGGAWGLRERLRFRATNRSGLPPESVSSYVGFRLVRERRE